MTSPNDAGRGPEPQPDANEPNTAINCSPEEQIRQFLALLIQPGEVFEVRTPKCKRKTRSGYWGTVVGYFTHATIDEAAKQIVALDDSGAAPAIYVTINPIEHVLLARSLNKLEAGAEHATGNENVLRRTWMLIDCDAIRAKGISSTAGELEAARHRADQVRGYLSGLGWPEPVVVMSGNGYHLLYAVDLPAKDEGVIERALKALSKLFSDGTVKIDESVHDAARVTKVAGTMVRKGDNLVGVKWHEDRPHRRAQLISAPDTRTVVQRNLLEQLAAEVPTAGACKPSPRGVKVHGATSTPAGQFDRFHHTPDGVRDYLARHGIVVTGEKRDGDRTFLFLDRCPVVTDCVSENKTDIAVLVCDDGVLGYKNMHDRGAGLSWLDLREALEPGYKAHASKKNDGKARHGYGGKSSLSAADVRLTVIGVGDNGRLSVSVTDATDKEIVRDRVDQNSSISRKRLIDGIASVKALGKDQRGEIDQAIRNLEPPQPADTTLTPQEALAQRDDRVEELLAATPSNLIAEAEAMLLDPNLIDRVVADIESLGVVGEHVLGLTIYTVGVSRLLKSPLSAKVQGTSSSGKSFIIERVGRLFPFESVLMATDLTSNALYYMEFGRLMHTLVLGGERPRVEDDERAESKRALREMISAKELRKVLPIKQHDGGLLSVEVYQPGPIAHIESTTNAQLFDEDANRTLMTSTDESPEQTSRIVNATAAAAESLPTGADSIMSCHVAIQRMLKRVVVRIPFARALVPKMPSQRPQARRAIVQIIGVVQAVALLYQRQRKTGPIEHGDVISATIDDYAVARRILIGPLGQSLGNSLPPAVERFARRLWERFGAETFSTTEAKTADGVLDSKGKVNEYLRALRDAGIAEVVGESRGSQPKNYRLISKVPEGGTTWLPTVADIEEAMS